MYAHRLTGFRATLTGVATLEPTLAVQTCENALRQLMTYVYRREYGESWLETVSTQDQRDEWQYRYEQERKRRGPKGVAVIPNVGLAYSDLSDLLGFLKRRWKPLEPALGNKAETRALLIRFESLRNSAMHARGLLDFEEDLLSGIAGQIRNQVTIYMSTQDPAGDYYPRIETIVDNFGLTYENPLDEADLNGPPRNRVQSTQIIRPGDTVTFTCTGFDPQERDLEFLVKVPVIACDKKIAAHGLPATLKWTVRPEHVRPGIAVKIEMKAVGAQYHRFGTYDQNVYFLYEVRPPGL